MDLASPDKEYRDQSIKETQRVIEITKELNKFFPKQEKPLIVANIGGFSMDKPIDFKFKDGQFLKTSGSTEGLLKLIGIINFDTLVRRMKLDFSDLYKEGLSFDSVEGRLNIADSVARFNDNPIIVKSPSSQFSLTSISVHFKS